MDFGLLTSNGDFSFFFRLQEFLERVIVLIKSRVFDGDDKVEKSFKTGFRSRRIVLDLKSKKITSDDDVDKINKTRISLRKSMKIDSPSTHDSLPCLRQGFQHFESHPWLCEIEYYILLFDTNQIYLNWHKIRAAHIRTDVHGDLKIRVSLKFICTFNLLLQSSWLLRLLVSI